jgi:zinc/manganese transport system substrate-binding protein
MVKKLVFLFVVLLILNKPLCHADGKLNVVTSTTLFEDLVKQIGCDRVEVRHVASPKFNIHFIQPRPSDVRNVAKADLYVFAGLDLEVWSDPLVEAAGKPEFFRGGSRSLDLSEGIRLLKVPGGALSRAEGDLHLFGNPHYAMNPENARIMMRHIVEKLEKLDPASASYFEENEKKFLSKLNRKIGEWKALCAPVSGKEIYSYHDDIEYFAEFAGLKADYFLEPKPGVPPTPKQFERLQDRAKSGEVKAIVMPTYYPQDTARTFGKRIGLPIVILAQSPGEVPGTEDFFSFFDYNFRQIAEAIK